MARSKPYTRWSLFGDCILTVLTLGAWWIFVPFRELYRFAGPKKK
jgi:hypothetical protein